VQQRTATAESALVVRGVPFHHPSVGSAAVAAGPSRGTGVCAFGEQRGRSAAGSEARRTRRSGCHQTAVRWFRMPVHQGVRFRGPLSPIPSSYSWDIGICTNPDAEVPGDLPAAAARRTWTMDGDHGRKRRGDGAAQDGRAVSERCDSIRRVQGSSPQPPTVPCDTGEREGGRGRKREGQRDGRRPAGRPTGERGGVGQLQWGAA
jgi:hypothetical protein